VGSNLRYRNRKGFRGLPDKRKKKGVVGGWGRSQNETTLLKILHTDQRNDLEKFVGTNQKNASGRKAKQEPEGGREKEN